MEFIIYTFPFNSHDITVALGEMRNVMLHAESQNKAICEN